jgi:hypothetical protein
MLMPTPLSVLNVQEGQDEDSVVLEHATMYQDWCSAGNGDFCGIANRRRSVCPTAAGVAGAVM